MTDRDEELGRELRRLDVPDHRPEFFTELSRRLGQKPARTNRPPPLYFGFAAAALVLVVFAVTTMLGGDATGPVTPLPPETRLISATEVRARVSTALSSLDSLRGEVAIECAVAFGECSPTDAGGRATLRWTFVTTAGGAERITAIGRRDDVGYRPGPGEQWSVTDGRPAATVISGLPPGPPDFAARPSVLRRDVASVVRAFLATTDDVPVTEVVEQDRPAWRLVAPVTPNKLAGPGGSGDRLEVVVDRETGFPLRVTESLAGRFLHEVRLSKLEVNVPVDPSIFEPALPAGVQPFRQDAGFRTVALGGVRAAAATSRSCPPSPPFPRATKWPR